MGLLQRLPAREIAFVAALLGAAGMLSWASGRTAILSQLLSPGWRFSQAVVGSVRGGATYFQDLDKLRKENAELRGQLTNAEAQLAHRLEVDSENQRLNQLLALVPNVVPHGIAARVIGRSPNNWQQRIVIDRGIEDGVGVDSVILTPRGVIGRVLLAEGHTAVVSLLTDPGQTVALLNQRSRSPGVALGEGETNLTLQYLPQQVDFHVGDAMATSGFGGVYPKGLSVGKVIRVDQQPYAVTPKVTIVLNVDLDRIEEVLALPPLATNSRLR